MLPGSKAEGELGRVGKKTVNRGEQAGERKKKGVNRSELKRLNLSGQKNGADNVKL